jgi:hypothetical protein
MSKMKPILNMHDIKQHHIKLSNRENLNIFMIFHFEYFENGKASSASWRG